MKVVLLGNQARAMSNFWSVLIRRLVAAGHEVVCLVPETGSSEDIEWERRLANLGSGSLPGQRTRLRPGLRLSRYPLDRKGLNPLRDLKTVRALRRFFLAERPDRLFAYTIKPVIYGSLAADLAGCPARADRTLMITGLGYMFEADSPGKRLLRRLAALLYRAAFCRAGRVFFQNAEDREVFERLSILPPGLTVSLSKGTGVDTNRFSPQPMPSGPPVFLFVGRLLEAKGLRELAGAARLVKATLPEARFHILGPPEAGPGSVPVTEIAAWQAEGIIEYLGETADVRPYLARATAVILPSWREGAPVSLLEAMSSGRAVIAADAPGSREVVRHGVNGLLTPLKDAQALAGAMRQFLDAPGLAATMGAAGREIALAEYDAGPVARELMRQMDIPEASA